MLIEEVVDRASLEQYVATTDWPDFLYFWGHTSTDNKIGKQVLSQWWLSPFEIAGTEYATAEHFMMAEKARIFGDEVCRSKILSAPTPWAAKKLGRSVIGYDDVQWADTRFEVGYRGNLAKFSQNAELRKFLLSTGDAVLVEASPVDTIWGIGLGSDDAGVHPEDWKGLNLLGFALVKVRAALKQEDTLVGAAVSDLRKPFDYIKQTKWIKREELDQALLAITKFGSQSAYFLSHRSDLIKGIDDLIGTLNEPDAPYVRRDDDVQLAAEGYATKFQVFYDRIVRGDCDPQ